MSAMAVPHHHGYPRTVTTLGSAQYTATMPPIDAAAGKRLRAKAGGVPKNGVRRSEKAKLPACNATSGSDGGC